MESWTVLNRDGFLGSLTDVMLVRRAGDMHDGIGRQRTFVLRLARKPVNVEFGVATDSQVVQAEARSRRKVGDLAERLRLSWEPTDITSRLHAQIVSHSTKLNKSLWSYVLSRFSGRELAQRVVDSGGRLRGGSVCEILEWCWGLMDRAEDMLSTSFRPQSCQRAFLRRATKEEFLPPATLRDRFQLNLMPPRIRLKTDQNMWLRKREVMRQFRDQKGSGPFLARNQFRILHSRAKACPSNGSFAETGPGCRKVLNLLNGLAHQFSVASSSQDASDSYSHLLLQAHKRFLADFKKRVREAEDDDEVQWLEAFQLELQDVDMFEFFLCECSKILAYLIQGHARYLRQNPDAVDDEQSDTP